MAVIQQPVVGGRASAVGRVARARRDSTSHPLAPWGPAILGTAVACVLCLTGWALLAQANFANVRLEGRISTLRVQNNMIAETIGAARRRDNVEAWAQQRGMERSGAAPVAIGGPHRGAEGW